MRSSTSARRISRANSNSDRQRPLPNIAPPRASAGRLARRHIAIVTDAGRAMRWTLMAPMTTALIADGEVVWSRSPVLIFVPRKCKKSL